MSCLKNVIFSDYRQKGAHFIINPCIEAIELDYFTKYFNNENNPFSSESLHTHDKYELFVMLEGEISYQIAGKVYYPTSTQIVIVPPATPHRLTINSDNAQRPLLRGIIVRFSLKTDETNSFFTKLFENATVINAKPFSEIIVLIHNIVRYSTFFTPQEFDFLKPGLVNQFAMLMYKYSNYYVDSNKNINHATLHVISYIDQHLTEKITVKTIASNFSFNEKYISCLFKKDMGKSIYKYINDRRLQLARTLIFGGEKPMQAMLKSGFSDYPNFYRNFTKHYGVSPRSLFIKYRNEALSCSFAPEKFPSETENV